MNVLIETTKSLMNKTIAPVIFYPHNSIPSVIVNMIYILPCAYSSERPKKNV